MKKLLFIIFLYCFCSCIIAQNSKIDSLFRSVYKDTLPGVSVAIMRDGKIAFEKSYGMANINTKEKISATSNFNICSLTKQFTAIGILQLEEKHLLTLNDKISKFFPDMNANVANIITIKELLTHSSGIIDHYDFINTANMRHAHNADVYNAIKKIDSTYFVPGSQFKYSNTAYCLLALIIEKVIGLSYNEYMKQNIFEPAGMMHTIIWNENIHIDKEATGYDFDSTSKQFKQSGANEHIFFSTEGDGGIYTSVNDYIKWFTALQSNKIFSKNIVDKARSIEFMIDSSRKIGYGFGWFVDESKPSKTIYHSGDNGGFRSYSFTIPSLNYMIVLFANRSDINLEELVQKIVQIQWPAMLPFIKIEALTS